MDEEPATLTNGIDVEFEKRLDEFGSHTAQDNKEALEEVGNTPEIWYLKTHPQDAPPQVITAKQLIETEFPPQVWTVENLIPAEGFTAITGAPFSFKSFITEHLAICVAANLPFFGHFQVTQGSVLMVDKENNKSLIKDRLVKLGIQDDPPIYFLDDPDKYDLSNDKILNWTKTFIEEKKIKLIILDSFAHIHRGDENDSKTIVQTFERLKQLPCAIVFIHHHRKAIKFFSGTLLDSIRGSSDIGAELEAHLALDSVSDGIKVTQGKNRRGQLLQPFKIIPLINETSADFKFAGTMEDTVTKVEQSRDLILQALAGEPKLSRREIVEMFAGKISERSISEALKALEKDNQVMAVFEGKSKYFSLTTPGMVEEGRVEWNGPPSIN